MFLDEFKELFRTIYSEKNTPERPLEVATYITFVDFLEKCEGKLSLAYFSCKFSIKEVMFVLT